MPGPLVAMQGQDLLSTCALLLPVGTAATAAAVLAHDDQNSNDK